MKNKRMSKKALREKVRLLNRRITHLKQMEALDAAEIKKLSEKNYEDDKRAAFVSAVILAVEVELLDG